MPIVDLKNCHLYLEDGTSKTGAINLMAGYTAGATSIVVDGFTGVIPKGARFRIGAAPAFDQYVVTSTVETTGNTTTVNFTPPLKGAAADNAVITFFGVFLEIRIGDGNIQWSENTPREFKKDRGRLYQVRDADEEPMDVQFQFMYEALTAADPMADPPTPEDALNRQGPAAGWVSTNPDPCAPYATNIRFDHTPPGCEAFLAERVMLKMFYPEKLDHDPKQGMISVTGKSNAVRAIKSRFTAA